MPQLTPIARTAFYCCALRAADAASTQSVCGDVFAANFLDDYRLMEMQPLLRLRGPSASNAARHRLIDDVIRSSLVEDPNRRIILLGAGFDTRAFRLNAGRWWEIDDANIIAFKELRLPAKTAPNPLVRIPVSFAADTTSNHLAQLAGDDPVLVVLEGVSMYLPKPALQDLAAAVRKHLPNARLVCDLMSPAFSALYCRGLRRELGRLGATFAKTGEHPRKAIEAAGYSPRHFYSIIGRACTAGTFKVPNWLLDTLLRILRDGYAVWEFDPRT